MSQVKKRDDLIHKENKLEVGGIPVHPGHMAAMQGEEKVKKYKVKDATWQPCKVDKK